MKKNRNIDKEVFKRLKAKAAEGLFGFAWQAPTQSYERGMLA